MRGCGHQEEVGVEALRHEFRCDPMRKRDQKIEREFEFLGLHHFEHGDFAVLKWLAVACAERLESTRVDEIAAPTRPGEQHATLFERLSNRGDTDGIRISGFRVARGLAAEGVERWCAIASLDFAAGKHECPFGEVDLVMAFDHEDFELLCSIAK